MKKTLIIDNSIFLARVFQQLLDNLEEGSEIFLKPGEYFKEVPNLLFMVKKNIMITGLSQNPEDVKLDCGFAAGAGIIFNLNNLTLETSDEEMSTVSVFDGAKLLCRNVIIDHVAEDNWITCYAQDSYVSLMDAKILSGNDNEKIALSIEGGQLFASKSYIDLMLQENTKSYMKNCYISSGLGLRDSDELFFKNLTFQKEDIPEGAIYVLNSSNFCGEEFKIANEPIEIHVFDSDVDIDSNTVIASDIFWYYNDESEVLINGDIPSNNSYD